MDGQNGRAEFFSHQLRREREQRGWSQATLAAKLNTDVKTISRWERGQGLPLSVSRQRLAEVLEKDLQSLGLLDMAETIIVPDLVDPMIPLPPAFALIGRADQLTALRKRLRSGGNVAISALNGLPGVGKTALSIALAHDLELQAHFKDGILWAGLGPEPNLQGHLSRWGTMLGIPANEMSNLQDIDSWGMAIRKAIGLQAMLLILDDAWAASHALALKVGGPNCAHLVTTRYPALASQFAADGATEVRELEIDEGVELLRTLAPQVVEKEYESARELVVAVGGLPLALTLLGNYLRTQAYMRQPRRIVAALQQLGSRETRLDLVEVRSPAERHSTRPGDGRISLRSLIAVSDQQLNQQAREAFYALAVFPPKPNNFSEEAALAVIGNDIQVLDTVLDTGLLQSSGPARYTVHQTIADYARSQQNRDVDQAQRRLVTYFVAFVEQNCGNYELLERESSTIFQALDFAQEADLISLAHQITPFLLTRGLYQTAETYLLRALSTAQKMGNVSKQIDILNALGQVRQQSGRFLQAAQCYESALSLARRLGINNQILDLICLLGSVFWKQGKYTEAEEYLQEGMLLAEGQDYPNAHDIYEILGSIAQRKGQFVQGEQYIREGIRLSHQQGYDPAKLSVATDCLGSALYGQGKYTEAHEAFLEGLALARIANHIEWICSSLNNLGEYHKQFGPISQAEEYLQEGLSLARGKGIQEWVCVLLESNGELARKLGKFEQARTYLQESFQVAIEVNIPHFAAFSQYELGCIDLYAGLYEQAESHFCVMKDFIPLGDAILQPLLLFATAQLAAAKGNKEEARELAQRAEQQATGYHSLEIQAWLRSL